MKDSTVIILVVAGVAVLFWAASRGFLGATGLAINPATGQAYGAVQVPQPSQNYSGYLAASTAPGVSSAINGALSGLGNLFSGWFGSSTPQTTAGQGANVNSPSLAAQPGGYAAQTFGNLLGQTQPEQTALQLTDIPTSGALVGPQISPILSYDTTSGSAFDYSGLSADNSYDPSYSLNGWLSA